MTYSKKRYGETTEPGTETQGSQTYSVCLLQRRFRTLVSPDIPADILKSLREDDYGTLKVRYGDPSWGSPIQYDYLEVESCAGIKLLEIFNRAILLVTRNTEETRRAHRIMHSLEKYMQSVDPQR